MISSNEVDLVVSGIAHRVDDSVQSRKDNWGARQSMGKSTVTNL